MAAIHLRVMELKGYGQGRFQKSFLISAPYHKRIVVETGIDIYRAVNFILGEGNGSSSLSI